MNKPPLAIVGAAPSAREDYEALRKLTYAETMFVGLDAIISGIDPRTVRFVVTNHLEDIPDIKKRLLSLDLEHTPIVSYDEAPGVDIPCRYELPSGSSAITGAIAALRMGYEKVILCGCPLTGNAPAGNPYEAFRPGWEAKKDLFAAGVRSMSGWTRDFLGAVTEEWFADSSPKKIVMDVPVHRIFTKNGDPLGNNPLFYLYREYLEKDKAKIREKFIKAFADDYCRSRINVTTDKIVTAIYEECGIEKPEDRGLCDAGIVREIDAMVETGKLKRDEPLRMTKKDGIFVLESCGYNDIAVVRRVDVYLAAAAWAAIGYSVVPDVEVIYAV